MLKKAQFVNNLFLITYHYGIFFNMEVTHMKKRFAPIMKKMVKLSTILLPALAVSFSMSPCILKMYEPKMPERLKR